MVCSLPPWLGPPLPQWRCICTAVKSQGSPASPIHSGNSITTDGKEKAKEKVPLCVWLTWKKNKIAGWHMTRISSLKWLKILKYELNLSLENKEFAARLQLRTVQYNQINRKAAGIPGRGQLAAIFTCVSVIVHIEGFVAVLTVAQWGQRDQTGVIFSLRGDHINRGLRSTTAVREILWPLSLAHQAFDRRKDRNNDVSPITQPTDSQSFNEKPPLISH